MVGITDRLCLIPRFTCAYFEDGDDAKCAGIALFWLVFEVEIMWDAPCRTHAPYEDED